MQAQGIGIVLRKLAKAIPMTHIITMDDDFTAFRLIVSIELLNDLKLNFYSFRICFQERGGPIDNDNLYEIEGSAVETVIMGKRFLDEVYYENNVLVHSKYVECVL
jgi:hypothetical protein